MIWITHLAFNLIVFYLLFKFNIFLFLGFIFSSFFIDFDYKRRFSWFERFLRIIIYYPLRIFKIKDKHRGILHSLFGIVLSSLLILIYLFPVIILFKDVYLFVLGYFIGGLLHIFLDCQTKTGVLLFFPFGFRLNGFIKTKGFSEFLFFVLMILFFIISLKIKSFFIIFIILMILNVFLRKIFK